MQWLGRELKYDKMEDWYAIDFTDFATRHGTGLLTEKYKGSARDSVVKIFGEHEWLMWKFKHLPTGFWDDPQVRFSLSYPIDRNLINALLLYHKLYYIMILSSIMNNRNDNIIKSYHIIFSRCYRSHSIL